MTFSCMGQHSVFQLSKLTSDENPASKLPSELLRLAVIFQSAQAVDTHSDTYELPIRVSYVNCRWRSVAIGSPFVEKYQH